MKKLFKKLKNSFNEFKKNVSIKQITKISKIKVAKWTEAIDRFSNKRIIDWLYWIIMIIMIFINIKIWCVHLFSIKSNQNVTLEAEINFLDITRKPAVQKQITSISDTIMHSNGGLIGDAVLLANVKTASVDIPPTALICYLNKLKISDFSKGAPSLLSITKTNGTTLFYSELHSTRRFREVHETKSDTSVKSANKESISHMIEHDNLPIELFFPACNKYIIKYVKETPNTDDFSLPSWNFTPNTSFLEGFTRPDDILPTDYANSVVFFFQEDRAVRQSAKPDLVLGAEKLFVMMHKGIISMDRISRKGDFFIDIPQASHTVPIVTTNNSVYPFNYVISPKSGKGHDSWLWLKDATNSLETMPTRGSLSIGKKRLQMMASDRVRLEGKLKYALVFAPSSLPKLRVEGKVTSIKINREEILKSRWGLLSPEIQGAIIGGFFGFIASALTIWISQMLKAKYGTSLDE